MKKYDTHPNLARDGVKKYARLSRAEAHCVELLHDNGNPQRRCELFGSADTTEFLIAKKVSLKWSNSWPNSRVITVDAIPPVQFIGLDEQFSLEDDMHPRACGMRQYRSPSFCEGAKEVGPFTDKTLYCFPNASFADAPVRTQENGWQYQSRADSRYYPCPYASWISLEDFPKTEEGVIMPLLGLASLRLTAFYGHWVSVEDTCNIIYANEFIHEPSWDLKKEDEDHGRRSLVCLSNLPEAFTRTVPVKSHLRRYNMLDDGGRDDQHPFFFDNILRPASCDGYATISNQQGTLFIPLSFYSYGGHPHPVTFPISPTSHFPLYCQSLIPKADRVYLTEFPRFADDNSASPIPVVSFLNGEWGLQFTDFDPLEGKEVVCVERMAANDTDLERAHRITLKAFAMAHKAGNRNFTSVCVENGQVVSYQKLLTEAIERGYLRDAGSVELGNAFDVCLPWKKASGKKEAIYGRAIQAGRINLFSAGRGGGKTELMLMLASIGALGQALDKSFFKYNLSKPCKTLYIQSEMDEENDLRNIRLKGLEDYICKTCPGQSKGSTADNVIFYTKKSSLVDVKEQCNVLKEIAKRDPEHQWQWCVVIDSIKTEMSEAFKSHEVYGKRVFPWLDFMRKCGISVDILDHLPKTGKSSGGTGTIEDLADECFYVEDAEDKSKSSSGKAEGTNGAISSHYDFIKITPDKRRILPGTLGTPAYVRWETDANCNILSIESWYEGEAKPVCQEQPTTVDATATSNPDGDLPANVPRQGASPIQSKIPSTWCELKALPRDEQRIALFELKNLYGMNRKLAEALKISEESIRKLMSSLGVNEITLSEYLRNKMK